MRHLVTKADRDLDLDRQQGGAATRRLQLLLLQVQDSAWTWRAPTSLLWTT